MNISVEKDQFAKTLMAWYQPGRRLMPWKSEKDPYLIWLSEVILQQTRVEQGMPYYLRFKNKYPSIEALAKAPEDQVMKLWQGLGYYSRAKNLHRTAKFIAEELQGVFPDSYSEILSLKGVGTYTAAAVASFAFGLPHAVVDGNVYRVLARIFGIDDPMDSSGGKRRFAVLANELLDKNNPAAYNQTILDFGAIQCSPKSPDCTNCPFNDRCFAYQNDKVYSLPVKSKKLIRKTRYFNYLVLNAGDKVVIRKRKAKDIWQHLYEFPLVESAALLPPGEVLKIAKQNVFSGDCSKLLSVSKTFVQQLTHQKIISRFFEIEADLQNLIKNDNYKIVTRHALRKFAFSKNIDWYLRDNSLTLEIA